MKSIRKTKIKGILPEPKKIWRVMTVDEITEDSVIFEDNYIAVNDIIMRSGDNKIFRVTGQKNPDPMHRMSDQRGSYYIEPEYIDYLPSCIEKGERFIVIRRLYNN